MTERQAVLALGSNLGDRGDILQGGVNAIAGIEGVQVTGVSPVYETVPVGGPPQPEYLNAVVLAGITIPALDLLGRLHEVEAAFDRVRLVRWGPRTLDIDIITVAGEHGYPPGGRPPVPPDVRAGGPDRGNHGLVRPASTDEQLREQRPYSENDDATVAITAIAAAAGAWCVRVHQVPANADAVRVAAAYRAAARS